MLRKLVQQVTKNTEKGIDNKADNGISDKGETLKQILEDWETEDLPTVPSEQYEKLKKKRQKTKENSPEQWKEAAESFFFFAHHTQTSATHKSKQTYVTCSWDC